MKVIIERKVHFEIKDFYDNALLLHEALDESTVNKKVNRLYEALYELGAFAHIYSVARVNKSWIAHSYREYICEDFHFAYAIYEDEEGNEVAKIHDARHSLLYY
jgi:hypothetical protein